MAAWIAPVLDKNGKWTGQTKNVPVNSSGGFSDLNALKSVYSIGKTASSTPISAPTTPTPVQAPSTPVSTPTTPTPIKSGQANVSPFEGAIVNMPMSQGGSDPNLYYASGNTPPQSKEESLAVVDQQIKDYLAKNGAYADMTEAQKVKYRSLMTTRKNIENGSLKTYTPNPTTDPTKAPTYSETNSRTSNLQSGVAQNQNVASPNYTPNTPTQNQAPTPTAQTPTAGTHGGTNTSLADITEEQTNYSKFVTETPAKPTYALKSFEQYVLNNYNGDQARANSVINNPSGGDYKRLMGAYQKEVDAYNNPGRMQSKIGYYYDDYFRSVPTNELADRWVNGNASPELKERARIELAKRQGKESWYFGNFNDYKNFLQNTTAEAIAKDSRFNAEQKRALLEDFNTYNRGNDTDLDNPADLPLTPGEVDQLDKIQQQRQEANQNGQLDSGTADPFATFYDDLTKEKIADFVQKNPWLEGKTEGEQLKALQAYAEERKGRLIEELNRLKQGGGATADSALFDNSVSFGSAQELEDFINGRALDKINSQTSPATKNTDIMDRINELLEGGGSGLDWSSDMGAVLSMPEGQQGLAGLISGAVSGQGSVDIDNLRNLLGLPEAGETRAIIENILPGGGAPTVPSFSELYQQTRAQYGMTDLENRSAELNNQLQAVKDDLFLYTQKEQDSLVAKGVIGGRISEAEKIANQRAFPIIRELELVQSQIETGEKIIENIVKLSSMDYEAARNAYNDIFSRNLQIENLRRNLDNDAFNKMMSIIGVDQKERSLTLQQQSQAFNQYMQSAQFQRNLKNDEWSREYQAATLEFNIQSKTQANASANLSTIQNLMLKEGLTYNDLPEAQKRLITDLEQKAGFPSGITQYIDARTGSSKEWQGSSKFVDSDGNEYISAVLYDKNTGEVSVEKIALGAGQNALGSTKTSGKIETKSFAGRSVSLNSSAMQGFTLANAAYQKQFGEDIKIGGTSTSSYRSQAETIRTMAENYGIPFNASNPNEAANMLRAAGHQVANVGESLHEKGLAVDIYPNNAYIAKVKPFMEANGWVQTLPEVDAGHFEYFGNKAPAPETLPLEDKAFLSDSLGNILGRSVKKAELDQAEGIILRSGISAVEFVNKFSQMYDEKLTATSGAEEEPKKSLISNITDNFWF